MSEEPSEGVKEQVEEVHHAPDTPVREVTPLKFFGPGEDPVTTMDFRPRGVVTTFRDDDEDHPVDENVEDGHGNFSRPKASPPVHPSTRRKPQPYDNRDDSQDASAEEPPEGAPEEGPGDPSTEGETPQVSPPFGD